MEMIVIVLFCLTGLSVIIPHLVCADAFRTLASLTFLSPKFIHDAPCLLRSSFTNLLVTLCTIVMLDQLR